MQLQKQPQHIAIIMDGNRRWAKANGFDFIRGHTTGIKTAKKMVKVVLDKGIPYLSLYVFSTENWSRSEQEVTSLMNLIHQYILEESDFYRKNKIRVLHSGNLSTLPVNIQDALTQVQNTTKDFDRLTVNLAINYGGRDEIIRAFKKWMTEKTSEELTEEIFHHYLDQPQLPPVDLLIRTAGIARISNFLIWQSTYAEFVFSSRSWPDWTAKDLHLALEEYQRRQRNFGI